ncbi:MAG: hypothetical protein KKA73_25445 [Chloroflexi bacterium]|nr:hypothetical protein [Chloroflexota bacterium]MBU1751042.1 hypothetical protein [Chloroflexota bacterium]
MKKRAGLILALALVVLAAAVGVFLLAQLPRTDAPARPPTAVPPTPPSAAAIYRIQVQTYLSPTYIGVARDLSPATVEEIIAVLDMLQPPPEMAAIHEEVLAGYRFILEGRQILTATTLPDGNRRAEGEFLVSWGVSRLLQAAQQLAAMS